MAKMIFNKINEVYIKRSGHSVQWHGFLRNVVNISGVGPNEDLNLL